MNVSCAELREAFRRGDRPQGDAVDRHVADCAACRELLRSPDLGELLARPEPTLELDPALEARVGSDIERERGLRAVVRALPTWQRALLCVAAVVGLVALQAGLRPSPGRGDWVAPFSAAFLLAAAAVLASARATPVWQKGAALVVAFGVPALVWGVTATDSGDIASPLSCLAYGAAFTLPLLGVFIAVERRDRLGPVDAALLAGALGLVAAIVLEFHCASTHRVHLLLGHAGVGWLFLAVGFAWTQLRALRAR